MSFLSKLNPKWVFYSILAIALLFAGYRSVSYLKNILGENKRLHEELIGKDEAYQQLSEHSAKLENQYRTQEELRQKTEERFKDEMSDLQGRLKILSDATFLVREKAREENNSDVVYKGDQVKYVLNEVRFDQGPAVGYVLIFEDGKVVSKLYNHEIKISTAVSRDEVTGKYSVVSKGDYVLKSPSLNSGAKNWFGKPFPLKITGGTAIIDPTEPLALSKHLFVWNPKLNANLNFDPNGVYPGLGISFMSYGVLPNDSDWKFLQAGAQYRKSELEPTFAPVLWRPYNGLLSNTYVGPFISYENPGIGYFLGITVGL